VKVLLTSNGLANDEIRAAYLELLEKPPSEMRAVFVTTASNIEGEDKTWLVNDIYRFHAVGFSSFDVLDISGLPASQWLSRIEQADAVIFGGGNSFHLLEIAHLSGDDVFQKLCSILRKRVYAGISAGSIAAAPNLSARNDMEIFPDDGARHDWEGFGLVDFYFIPHLNSPDFPKSRAVVLQGLIEKSDNDIRSCDDDTAIVVHDDALSIVGTGTNVHYTSSKSERSAT